MEDIHVIRYGQLASTESLQETGLAAAIRAKQPVPPARNVCATSREVTSSSLPSPLIVRADATTTCISIFVHAR